MSKSPRIWEMANSPLVLWILSSVVLTYLGAKYSEYSQSIRMEAERKAQIERTKKQVTFRLEVALMLKGNAANAELELDALLNESIETRLYPEFEDRSTLAMVMYLEHECPSCFGDKENAEAETMDLLTEAISIRM